MIADAPLPLVGRTVLTPADAAAVNKALCARIGFFNQPRLLLYSSIFAMVAAGVSIAGRGLAAPLLLVLAIVCFALAIWAGQRMARVMSKGFGLGEEREIALDDESVTVGDPGMTVIWSWSRFERAVEAPDYIVLVADMGVILVIKRGFDAETFTRVRALIAAKVPASGLP
jgi:hypothetical protein